MALLLSSNFESSGLKIRKKLIYTGLYILLNIFPLSHLFTFSISLQRQNDQDNL